VCGCVCVCVFFVKLLSFSGRLLSLSRPAQNPSLRN
jgi:hypothetical protein